MTLPVLTVGIMVNPIFVVTVTLPHLVGMITLWNLGKLSTDRKVPESILMVLHFLCLVLLTIALNILELTRTLGKGLTLDCPTQIAWLFRLGLLRPMAMLD